MLLIVAALFGLAEPSTTTICRGSPQPLSPRQQALNEQGRLDLVPTTVRRLPGLNAPPREPCAQLSARGRVFVEGGVFYVEDEHERLDEFTRTQR